MPDLPMVQVQPRVRGDARVILAARKSDREKWMEKRIFLSLYVTVYTNKLKSMI